MKAKYILRSEVGCQTADKANMHEHGVILSYEDNVRQMNVWMGCGIALLTNTVGVTIAGDVFALQEWTVATALVLACFGLASILYGGHRYFRILKIIENPGIPYYPDNVFLLVPTLVTMISSVAAMYLLTFRPLTGF